MHREDDSRFLLYIHPPVDQKLAEPIDDDLTRKLEAAFAQAVSGVANYSRVGEPESFIPGSAWCGGHRTDCGKNSDNHDYLLPNGLITNSLCVFYVRWYRNSIPACDMRKLQTLYGIAMLNRLNWIFFPVFYPIALVSAIVTMLILRIALGWRFPVRWYTDQAYKMSLEILGVESVNEVRGG